MICMIKKNKSEIQMTTNCSHLQAKRMKRLQVVTTKKYQDEKRERNKNI